MFIMGGNWGPYRLPPWRPFDFKLKDYVNVWPFLKLPKLAFICTIVVQAQLLLICFWIANDHGKTFRTLWGIWCEWSRDIEWFREPGFLDVAWFGSSPTSCTHPSPISKLSFFFCLPVCRCSSLLTGERERWWGGEKSDAALWNLNYFLRFRFQLLKSYGSGSGSVLEKLWFRFLFLLLKSYGYGSGSGSSSIPRP